MAIQDIKDSMKTPPAPAFDGNGSGPLSTGLEGKWTYPDPKVGAAPPDRDSGGIVVQGSPCRGDQVGVLGPVQGLDSYGSGKVIDAPSSQARETPDTKITNVDPLAQDKTPGYGGR